MAKQVMQFRYYGTDNDKASKNYPSSVTLDGLKNGTTFEGYFPIIQLGIQSLPGTHFYLNNSNTSVIIGSTGIYELDLEGYTEINDLRFDLQSLTNISDNPNAYLIIDIISDLQEVV